MDSNEEYTQRYFFEEPVIKTSNSPDDRWEVVILKDVQLGEEKHKMSLTGIENQIKYAKYTDMPTEDDFLDLMKDVQNSIIN